VKHLIRADGIELVEAVVNDDTDFEHDASFLARARQIINVRERRVS
jgi:hypothetical protein